MLVSGSSRTPRTSKPPATPRLAAVAAWAAVTFALAVIAAAAVWIVSSRGYTLYYGDAEAHLNIARRIVDSRTPGPEQIGTVWLPLPHIVMLPLVLRGDWWQTGMAGAIVGAASFVLAGCFLFGAARRAFASTAAGVVAAGLFALNPNMLYLSATPMTEPILFAGLAGTLYASVAAAQTKSWWAVIAAGAFSNIASLTRYEGWFVLPFVALYLLVACGLWRAVAFAAIAALGPLSWLAHNEFYYANPLEFYNGPYSAKAIYQRALNAGMARYPGDHEWSKAFLYFRTAAEMCAGWGLVAVGVAGAVAALIRRAWWPLLFLLLPSVFYVLSLYSSGTPIFVPTLWPNSYYNTRYGMAALPLLAFAGAALVALLPAAVRNAAAVVILAVAAVPWAWSLPAVTWKESEVNSSSRRAWTREAAGFLAANYHHGDGVLASFGDLTGIFREAGIPLQETLHEGNGPAWYGALARPDLMLHEDWAVAMAGDAVATAMQRTARSARPYRRVKIITSPNAPVIEIYRREPDANPVYQSARREERLSSDLGQ